MSSIIYLDNHATTPCDPRVLEVMLPFFTHRFGNASSLHAFGEDVTLPIEKARIQVATLLNASPNEIIFTSGATESNNIAILGVAHQHKHVGGLRRRIVTTVVEHKAVLGPCDKLAEEGEWEIIYLPVDKFGQISLAEAEHVITDETLLVTIQVANSEIGTIQPITALAEIAHKVGALIHCDAAQAVGKINVNVEEWDIDLLSLSGHKIYGPKGIGALWLRGGTSQLNLKSPIRGGSQEGGLRPGTLPVPLVIGLGEACFLCTKELKDEFNRVTSLRNQLEQKLLMKLSGRLFQNGSLDNRLPHNSSLCFTGIEAEMLLANLPELAISTGAACESGSLEPSRVLISLGLSRDDANSTLRFGLGRFTTSQEIDRTIELILAAYEHIQQLIQ